MFVTVARIRESADGMLSVFVDGVQSVIVRTGKTFVSGTTFARLVLASRLTPQALARPRTPENHGRKIYTSLRRHVPTDRLACLADCLQASIDATPPNIEITLDVEDANVFCSTHDASNR